MVCFGASPLDHEGHQVQSLPHHDVFVGVRNQLKTEEGVRVELNVVEGGHTMDHLALALTRWKPHLLHLYLHGQDQGDSGLLSFETEGRKEHLVEGFVLKELLERHSSVKVVVLTVCGVGKKVGRVVATEQRLVVGTEGKVEVEDVAAFSKLFYLALGKLNLRNVTVGDVEAEVKSANSYTSGRGRANSPQFGVYPQVISCSIQNNCRGV